MTAIPRATALAVLLLSAFQSGAARAGAPDPTTATEAAEARLAEAISRFERLLGPVPDPAGIPPLSLISCFAPSLQALELGTADLALMTRLRELPAPKWTAADLAAFNDLLARNAAALQAVAAEGLDSGPCETDAPRQPHAMQILQAARPLALEGEQAIAEGRLEDARLRARQLGELAVRQYREPGYLSQMLALSLDRMWLELVQRIGTAPVPAADAGLLTLVSRDLAALPRPYEALLILRTEAARFLRPNVETHIAGEEPQDEYRLRVWPGLLDLFSELAETEALPLAGALDRLRAPAPGPRAEAGAVVANRLRGPFVHLVARLELTEAARRFAQLALDLRAEALAAGAYPATLDQRRYDLAPEVYGEGEVRYAVQSDGSAALMVDVPPGPAVEPGVSPAPEDQIGPLLRWRLPPIKPASPIAPRKP